MSVESFCDDAKKTTVLAELVCKIVETESPISTDLLTARLLELKGFTKTSPRLKARCDYLIKFAKKNLKLVPSTQYLDSEDLDSEKLFWWSDSEYISGICPYDRTPDVGETPRKASDIARQEAARAAVDIAEVQCGLPRESLIMETAKALGFTRTASNTDCYKLCEQAVDYAYKLDALNIDDNGFITSADSN